MQASITPEPQVVSQDEWLAERMKLLLDEQELTKHRDRPPGWPQKATYG